MITLTGTALLLQLFLTTDREFLRVARAILWVESKGDPSAVGDSGRALGGYQIHKAYWADAMRILGESWPYSDARDPVKALAAVRAYTRHYAKAAGIPWTAENIARLHNGGPKGWKKTATRVFWAKVKAALQTLP